MNSTKDFSALSAYDHIRKAVVTAEATLFAVLAEMNTATTNQFLLHLHEDFSRDNRLMAVLYIVLRNDTVVLDPLFCKKIIRIGFLQERISDVLFISQNIINVTGVPALIACTVQNTVGL